MHHISDWNVMTLMRNGIINVILRLNSVKIQIYVPLSLLSWTFLTKLTFTWIYNVKYMLISSNNKEPSRPGSLSHTRYANRMNRESTILKNIFSFSLPDFVHGIEFGKRQMARDPHSPERPQRRAHRRQRYTANWWGTTSAGKDGRREGREYGRTEGREIGREDGGTDGRTDAREDGRRDIRQRDDGKWDDGQRDRQNGQWDGQQNRSWLENIE